MAMVTVSMGDDDVIKSTDVGGEKLLPKVWPAIDQHALASAFDQD